MTAETLLVIFVGITALAMVVQIIFMIRTMLTAKHLLNKAEAMTTRLEKDSRELVEQANEIAVSFENVRKVFEDVAARAEEISRLFEVRAQEVEQLVGRVVDVGKRQAAKVDDVVGDTVRKFEETTGIVQEDILKPVIEISSLIKGIKTGLEYLLSARNVQQPAAYEEEDHFV